MSDQAVILLIEDDPNDVLLFQRAFSQAKVLNPVHTVCNAEQAKAYFLGTDRYANRLEFPLPELVLLDLKLPGMDGFAFLEWLRGQPGIGETPVVVVSGADRPQDINRAYNLGANTLVIKPVDSNKLVEITRALNAIGFGYTLRQAGHGKTGAGVFKS